MDMKRRMNLNLRGALLKIPVAMESIARCYRRRLAWDSERILTVERLAGNRRTRHAADRRRVLEAHIAEGEPACEQGDHCGENAGLAEARRVRREAGRPESGSAALGRARQDAFEISGCHLLGGGFGGGLVETEAPGGRDEMTVRHVRQDRP